jgi:hypothetical protein
VPQFLTQIGFVLVLEGILFCLVLFGFGFGFVLFIYFFVVVGFELRALCLLTSHSTI